MRRAGGRAIWTCLMAALALSCGGADGAASRQTSGDGIRGGQTGSLTPSCGVARGPASVPAGDSALVVHTAGCSMPPNIGQIEIVGPDGDLIPFYTVQLDDGAVLLRTVEMLEPGSYEVSTETDGDVELEVTDVAPLPTRLGELRFEAGSDCSPAVVLNVDESALAYEGLLRVMLSIDGNEARPWVEYGKLRTESGEVRLELPACPAESCLDNGPHEVEVFGVIAGEEFETEVSSTEFDLSCARDRTRGCSVVARSGSTEAQSWALALWWAALAAWVLIRRRRSAPGQLFSPIAIRRICQNRTREHGPGARNVLNCTGRDEGSPP